jgi:hypothetical protein
MWHRVDIVLTDVSEERFASIVRVEGKEDNRERTSTTSQKTAYFIVTALITSNLTYDGLGCTSSGEVYEW